jgi:hypothetical protein
VVKAETRGWDTVMLDVGRHVLMMWEAGGKTGIVRVLLRIIPTQLLLVSPDLVWVHL